VHAIMKRGKKDDERFVGRLDSLPLTRKSRR
jgi:hypothetical protein